MVMRSDEAIKQDVEQELQWDPEIDSPDIAVSVKNGVVTLTGFARAYVEIGVAEAAAKRVAGVTGVANDIELRIPGDDPKPDPEIAREALQAIRLEWPSLLESIRLDVKDGWVVLEGEVQWNYQRERVEAAVRRVRGLKGITNLLEVKPRLKPQDLERQIEEALKRSAAIDTSRITVEINGDVVTLKGTLRTWSERQEAERVAWAAPGVRKVESQIAIFP
jgi:osmotically-inducible protein OsmY